MVFSPSVFDRNVTTFDKTGFAKALPKRC